MDFSKPYPSESEKAFEHFQSSAAAAINQLHFVRAEVLALASSAVKSTQIYSLGVGKMSYIAGKFAASLRSIGMDAHFLDATHLAHGDLGVLRRESLAVIFSKSGNSSELKVITPFLKGNGAQVALVTARRQSPLAECADIIIPLSLTQEGDKHNLLPLCSTLLAMAIGDAVISVISDIKLFTPESFAAFHPAGQIGLNLNRCVADLTKWKSRTPFISPDATCSEAMEAIGKALCGLACVLNQNGELIAIVSDGDLRRALVSKKIEFNEPIQSILNHNPTTVQVSFNLRQVYDLMEGATRKFYAIPVLDKKKCIGVMNIHDLF
jgi:arabinose-5-phosphate isomerase